MRISDFFSIFHVTTLHNLPAIVRESAHDLQVLHDKVKHAVASLKNLNRNPAELWNDILVYLITQKLDPATLKVFNVQAGDSDTPILYEDLSRFLTLRIPTLEECAAVAKMKSAARPGLSSHVCVYYVKLDII